VLFLFTSLTVYSQEKGLDLRYRSIDVGTKKTIGLQGIKQSTFENKVFVIASFERIPTPSVLQLLSYYDVQLLEYLGSNTYIISIPKINFSDFQHFTFFVSYHLILPSDKVHERLKALHGNSINKAAEISISLSWFKGINSNSIQKELIRLGCRILSFSPSLHNATISIKPNQIDLLSQQACVYWLEPLPPPVISTNLPGKTSHRSNVLNKSSNGRNLTGEHVKIGIWDVGQIGEHIDFGNRVTNGNNIWFKSAIS